MGDILTWLEDLIGSILMMLLVLSPFYVPVLIPFIFFIAFLKRFRQTPEEETKKRKIYRKMFIVSLIPTVVLAVICFAMFISFTNAIANM